MISRVTSKLFLSSHSCPSELLNLKRGDGVGAPGFLATVDRSMGTLGTQYLRLASEVGGGLVGVSPDPSGSDTKPGQSV